MLEAPSVPEGADLTPNEVADSLRVNYDHVLRLIRDGSLQAYKVGKGGYRVRPCDLERFKSGTASALALKAKVKRSRSQLRPPA